MMVIDCVQYRVANSRLFNFLKENSHTNLELQLIHFWSRHPRAKLSLYTIANALDTARINLREAIRTLMEKGILQEQEDGNGLITYSLASDPQTQEYIEELARLDWNEIRVLEKQLEGEPVLA
jgi:predicted DNA-binding transcriptional regulator